MTAGTGALDTPEDRTSPAFVRFVLPAFNEAASIGDLLRRITAVVAPLGIPYGTTVVDDGSTDETASIVEGLAGALPVELLRHSRNMGLGPAIADGLRHASAAAGDGDVIVTMDSDLTQDPEYVPSMLDAWRGGADIVIASRFRPGARVHGLSPFRRFMTLGARVVMSSLMRVPGVRDYSCGYRLYAAPVLKRAFARWGDEFIRQSGFACMVEIIVKLSGTGVIAEVPFELHYDEKRKPSTMRVWRTVRAYFEVIAEARRMRRVSPRGGERA